MVLKDQGTRVAQSYVYELSRRLDEVCWSLGVEIDGALEVRMSPEDTDRWLHNMLPR